MDVRTSTDRYRDALSAAIRFGMMSARQYEYVADEVSGNPANSLLVFGVGYDAPLWNCVANEVGFVEDNLDFLSLAPARARTVIYEYRTCVGRWVRTPKPPMLIDRPWDYILVDGPAGFSTRTPGRQWPIVWSKQLARKAIFVHDYDRIWERNVCDHVLGDASEILVPPSGKRGTLAFFRISNCANERL